MPGENSLGNDSPSNQATNVKSHDGDNWDHGVSEGMTHDYCALGKTLSTRCSNVILIHNLQKAGPCVASVGSYRADRQSDGRQQQVTKPIKHFEPHISLEIRGCCPNCRNDSLIQRYHLLIVTPNLENPINNQNPKSQDANDSS